MSDFNVEWTQAAAVTVAAVAPEPDNQEAVAPLAATTAVHQQLPPAALALADTHAAEQVQRAHCGLRQEIHINNSSYHSLG